MRVILIEDEALIAHNLKYFLEEKNIHVELAYTYDQGMELIMKDDYDIMVTDINLGNIQKENNGLELIKFQKKNGNRPVIILTAFSDDPLIEEAISLEIDNYLVKPINPVTLYASLKTIYNQNKNTHQSFFVRIGTKFTKVFINDIYYLGASKNYVSIKIFNSNIDIPYRGSLQEVFEKLIPDQYKSQFIKINRGEYILKSIVTKFNKSYVTTPYGEFKVTANITIKDFEILPGQ